jgi:YfiH family protein
MTPERLGARSLPFPHGFFTRRGGVSEGPYATLNANLASRDRRDAVRENRARAARAIGADPAALLGLTQVHGTRVVQAERPWPTGEGPVADAVVSNCPGIALAIVTADCVPVLLADPTAAVIGAAHAGWRGAVAGVLEATVAAMRALGAAAERIVAVVGPAIGQASYEVGPDVRAAVLAHEADDTRFFARGRDEEHWQFDLGGYCAARLARARVTAVDTIGADTAAEPDRFFSHRRRTLSGGGPIGHQISAIALPE